MAKITTNKTDYAPGETVNITASNFTSGSQIQFQILNLGADGVQGTADDFVYAPWFVTDGLSGDSNNLARTVGTTWTVPDSALNSTLILTATGDRNGDGIFGNAGDVTATTTFTDAGPTITTTGTTVTHDETSGLQNFTATPTPAGDANDNDIAVASLPTVFSTRLTALSAGTAIGAALSGYTGAAGNTGSNVFTVSGPGTITDLALTKSDGTPLNGDESGLLTSGGANHIFLYTDTNNNIVLGREGTGATASASGAIVFAVYLDESATPGAGGKIWTEQFKSIQNPNTTNPDDAVDLTNHLYVTAFQDQEFSLANAPSGQNLFLMFGGTDVAIVVTGKAPANQSTGVSITTGDTVNTSQGGGTTTFGINNQMFDPGEGAYFTYVTGANSNFTIPNLDQNEADVEANIAFTGVFGARAATFTVSQLQPAIKAATLKLTAKTTAVESGVNFVDGLTGDAGVNIDHVKVFNASGTLIEEQDAVLGNIVNSPNLDITFSGGIATISGAKTGYRVEFRTVADSNRVLIENAGSNNANFNSAFDIGGFKLLQATKTTAEIGSKVFFEDDGPSITVSVAAAADALTVDETDLTTNASASFADNFSNAPLYGADGAGTVSSAYALSVSSSGVASGLVDVATDEAVLLTVVAGVVQGRTATSDALVFTVSVDGSGQVTLD